MTKLPITPYNYEYNYCSIRKKMIWILVVLIIWLTVLSSVVLLIRGHYKRLVEIGGKRDLKAILERILDRLEEDRVNIDNLSKILKRLEQEGEFHIQKVGVVRFNPFPEVGGNQSFVLAFLDKNNNGIVVSSLYGREATRWYVKSVVGGKGKDIELSKEEERAIQLAEKNRYKF